MKIIHYLAFITLLSVLSTPVLKAQNEQGASSDAAADARVRILEIQDGDVKLDGRVLPMGNLPDGLRLDGIDMTYHFSGPVTPVLEIDGEVYVLDGEQLIRMDEAGPNRANVYFLGQPEMTAQNAPVTRPRPEGQAFGGEMPADDLERAGEEAYLQQLSSRDRTLYDQIQQEQSLELETYSLAGEFRRTRNRDEQADIADELRDKLEESFDLKQQIRADEIAQAESQISELRRLLNERSARKEQIIERRLRELIGKQGN